MNVAELKIKLEELGIPKNAYSLPDNNAGSSVKNGGVSLQCIQNITKNGRFEEWTLSILERGRFYTYASFYSEAGACETLYFLLCEDYGKEALLGVDENPQMNVNVMIETLDRKGFGKKKQGSACVRGNTGIVSYLFEDSEYSLEYDPQSQLWCAYDCGHGDPPVLYNSFHSESTACEEFLKIMEYEERRNSNLYSSHESTMSSCLLWIVYIAFVALGTWFFTKR